MVPAQDRYDLIVLGAGIGGLSAAIAGHDSGMRVLVVEKSGSVGGVTAYSNGNVWVAGNHLEPQHGIDDSPEAGARYLSRIGMGLGDPAQLERLTTVAPEALRYFEEAAGVSWRIIDELADYYYPMSPDALPQGRYVEVTPFAGATLGDWQERTRRSPHVPFRAMSSELHGCLGIEARAAAQALIARRADDDARCLGPGLAAAFVKGALDRDVEILTNTTATELARDGGCVSGIRLGSDVVAADRGVVLATGAYDWDPELTRTLEWHVEFRSATPPSVTGDHLRLAAPFGAQLARVPRVAQLGYTVPGAMDEGRARSSRLSAMGNPHAILVNRRGRRFGDESFYPDIGHALRGIDGATQTLANLPCWVIFDEQHRRRYPFGVVAPGEPFPDALGIVSAPDLDELARAVGIDPLGLADQVARFNEGVRAGRDPEFRRGERPWAQYSCGDPANEPNPNLGTIETPPFHAFQPVVVGVGIPSAGLVTDLDAQVLTTTGTPIEGLYAVGNSMAHLELGAGYQSGVANARGMTFGYLAARHAAALNGTVTAHAR